MREMYTFQIFNLPLFVTFSKTQMHSSMIELASGSGGSFLHQIYLDELFISGKILGLSSSKWQRERLPSSFKSREMSAYSWTIFELTLKNFVNISNIFRKIVYIQYTVIFIMNCKFHTVNAFIIKMFLKTTT